MQRDSEQDNGHSSDLDRRKKWYSFCEDSPQGEWDKIAELMMFKIRRKHTPVFRSTSPLSRGVLKSKGGGSLYGAVAEMCEEFETYHDRTERSVVKGQSNPLFVPGVIKTHTHTHTFDR